MVKTIRQEHCFPKWEPENTFALLFCYTMFLKFIGHRVFFPSKVIKILENTYEETLYNKTIQLTNDKASTYLFS